MNDPISLALDRIHIQLLKLRGELLKLDDSRRRIDGEIAGLEQAKDILESIAPRSPK